jgi:uncharacterized protein (TIGR00290 family)
MLTMFDEELARSRSHGLRPDVLTAQAERLGLSRVSGRCTWATYDAVFTEALRQLSHQGITHVIFGDILLEEHRQWAEQMCHPHGLTAVEPLFGSNTDDLFDEWISTGGSAVIVTARAEFFDESWLGRPLRSEMRPEFERLGVDRCGERGEYHTLVTDGPWFSSPLPVRFGERVLRSGCWALDVVVDGA